MRKSVGKESKLDKVNSTRCPVMDGVESGHSRREGEKAAGRFVVGRRKSLRPTAYAIRAAQQQKSEGPGKREESRETGHSFQYPSLKRFYADSELFRFTTDRFRMSWATLRMGRVHFRDQVLRGARLVNASDLRS